MHYEFNYGFAPVGQGLFAYGSIEVLGDTPAFSWVYDCGTVSSQALVENALVRLESFLENRKHLDLVTISHFDKDHVSGVCNLISKFTIGTLVLPYMALWQRLMVAFQANSRPQDDHMLFMLNPTAYLTAVAGAQVERILYVLPGGERGDGQPAMVQPAPSLCGFG